MIDIKSTNQARIDKLESRVEREKSSKQRRKIADINADVEINLEKAQAEANNLDLDYQEKILSMLDVNDEEPADVEEVLGVVKAVKLITEVVTTAGLMLMLLVFKILQLLLKQLKLDRNNMSLNNDLRGLNKLHNWYQSLVALDLGSTRFLKKPINPNFQEVDLCWYTLSSRMINTAKVLSMLDVNNEEHANVEEVLEVVKAAKLITKVVTTAEVDVNAASVQDTPITGAEAAKVFVLRKRREPKPLKREAQIELDEDVARHLEAELNADINWNVVIKQVKKCKRLTDAVMKYQALKRKPLTKAQDKRNMIVYLKNMVGYKMDYFKGMSYDEIIPLFEKHYNYNQAFLNKKTWKLSKQGSRSASIHLVVGWLILLRCYNLEITYSCLNDVDEDLKDIAMCDFSYDALCTHWLSLKRVTLFCSVSCFIVDSDEPVMEMEKSSKQVTKIAVINADVEINLEKAQAEAH
uniref:Uncharacterized protein n=1 Tax=Tanacetum cinerariifolium TaxID=118510 RepID=A0A699HPM8_TANCI|nr:hypothetical protein [Tanacetum cinerariifolium]